MAKSSRHRSSHKQSKRSSKEARDYSSSSEEDVKVKDRSGKGESRVRVSRDSDVREKRKLSSQSRGGHGEASEERVSSKRRKDVADEREDCAGAISEKVLKSGSSRLESEKISKSSKAKAESRSRSSRRSENGGDRKEENVEIVDEKLESKLKDMKESDLGRIEASVLKEKECGSDKDMKVNEKKLQDAEKHADYSEGKKKPKSRSLKNSEKPKQHDLANTGPTKELEKQVKSGDGYIEKDEHLDDNKRGNEDGKLSSRKERDKGGRYKEDKHIDGSYKDSYRDDVDRESRHRDSKHKAKADIDGRNKDGRCKEDKHIDGFHIDSYKDGIDGESRHRDGKHREDADRDCRHKDKHFDGSYKDDVDKESRHRDSRHKEETDRDGRHRDDKHREDIDKDGRYNYKDGKQRENCDQNSIQGDGKQRDDFDKDIGHMDGKQRDHFDQDSGHKDSRQGEDVVDKDGSHKDCKEREDGDRERRYRKDKYREAGDKEKRCREDKYREDGSREKRYREDKYREDDGREKRYREDKYKDEYVLRDRPNDNLDAKRTRDESSYSESRSRKLDCQYSKHDSSPVYIDQDTKYKDDDKTRRFYYREDERGTKSRKTSEQYSDVGNKSMNTSRTQIVNDKDRPHSCNADADSRHASSPNFGLHGQKDKFRHSKQAEPTYIDLSSEEKVVHDTNSYANITGSFGISDKTSMPQPRERHNGEDYNTKHELSSERYLPPDVHTSPGQLVGDSTTSGVNLIHIVEAGVRQSSDAEEFGQKSKDAMGLLSNESKKRLDLPLETPSAHDIFQVDGGNLSPPSPISRTSHLPGNSRSRFHSSPSFRASKGGPSAFGSFEEDSRGRSNNRYTRNGNSNMGRAHGNAWNGVPNWSSPVTGNFVHFQNGPPSVGFHPMMQQFSGPPMFGIRPFMEFPHSRGPYPIPDANAFSSHEHPFRWPQPAGDSCLPLSHGWDVKNDNDAHMYGRLDWDHNRSSMNHQGCDAGADTVKGQSSLVTNEKEDSSVHALSDDISAAQSNQQTSNDLKELNFEEESSETYQHSDILAKETYKSSNTATTEKHYPSNMSQSVDVCYFHAYLSKLDISADLSHPDLYDKCRNLMDMKQSEISSHFSDIEKVSEARVKISKLSSNSSLFVAINDSVYQKAIQFYKKQQEEMRAFLPSLSNGNKHPLYRENMEASADSDLKEKKAQPAVTCDKPIPSVEVAEMDSDNVVSDENPFYGVEDKVSVVQDSLYIEEDVGIPSAGNIADRELLDSTSSQLLFSDVPSSQAVNLTRIHHSTGSTH